MAEVLVCDSIFAFMIKDILKINNCTIDTRKKVSYYFKYIKGNIPYINYSIMIF